MSFMDEIVKWLDENAPTELLGTSRGGGAFDGYWGGRRAVDSTPARLRWLEVCASRGLCAPTWLPAYGGAGLSREEAASFEALLRERGLPQPLVGFGLAMLGPVLLEFGTEDQKRRHLPGIASGQIRWCQGYSEPEAGSDLAALACKAEIHDEEIVLTGQKVWTSHADECDCMFALVRTSTKGRKQEGISFVLVDLEQSGVERRRIRLISGASPFCEVFFDEARAKLSDLVGGRDQGWTVAKALLGHERTAIGSAIGSQLVSLEKALVGAARQHLGVDDGPLPDGLLRDAIARCLIDERCLALTISRVGQSDRPGPESSVLKIVGSEIKQRRHALMMRLTADEGLGADDDVTRDWLRSRANTIEGGTTEIQLNIIAQRVLGLST